MPKMQPRHTVSACQHGEVLARLFRVGQYMSVQHKDLLFQYRVGNLWSSNLTLHLKQADFWMHDETRDMAESKKETVTATGTEVLYEVCIIRCWRLLFR